MLFYDLNVVNPKAYGFDFLKMFISLEMKEINESYRRKFKVVVFFKPPPPNFSLLSFRYSGRFSSALHTQSACQCHCELDSLVLTPLRCTL